MPPVQGVCVCVCVCVCTFSAQTFIFLRMLWVWCFEKDFPRFVSTKMLTYYRSVKQISKIMLSHAWNDGVFSRTTVFAHSMLIAQTVALAAINPTNIFLIVCFIFIPPGARSWSWRRRRGSCFQRPYNWEDGGSARSHTVHTNAGCSGWSLLQISYVHIKKRK